MEKISKTVGLVDPDGLTGGLPKDFKAVGSFHKSYDGESCDGKKVSTALPLDKASKAIQKKCETGYYALLWDSSTVKVIFRDRIFSISKRPTEADLKEIKDYGKKHGVNSKFFDGIKDDVRLISAKKWLIENCRFAYDLEKQTEKPAEPFQNSQTSNTNPDGTPAGYWPANKKAPDPQSKKEVVEETQGLLSKLKMMGTQLLTPVMNEQALSTLELILQTLMT